MVDVMYQYSLAWFQQLFVNSLETFRAELSAAAHGEGSAAEQSDESLPPSEIGID